MMAGEEDANGVDFVEDDGLSSWLPTYVLNDVGICEEQHRSSYFKDRSYNKHRNLPPQRRRSPAAGHGQPPPFPSPHARSGSKPYQKPKYPTTWAAGGPGMQAVFLDSGQRSCGTGVFLPRIAGNDDAEKTKKPAVAPVLLPSRVVQALNLNIHELGLQIKPRDLNNNPKSIDYNEIRNKKGSEIPSQICVISQNRSSSPEIFLPKEWTY